MDNVRRRQAVNLYSIRKCREMRISGFMLDLQIAREKNTIPNTSAHIVGNQIGGAIAKIAEFT